MSDTNKNIDFYQYKLITEAINHAVNQILRYCEASVNPSNFSALRKLILDTFGESGIRPKLREILFKGRGNESQKKTLDKLLQL